MPQNAYSDNVFIPPGVSAQARQPHEDPWGETSALERLGDDSPWPTPGAVQASHNAGGAVVVCLGVNELLSLTRTTPVYTNLSTREQCDSDSDERFDFSELFSILERRAEPVRARECRGGVLVAAANTQTHTDTANAFVADLDAACAWVETLAAARSDRCQGVRAALVWPTRLGHFHLEYEFQPQSDSGWWETVRFGFLLPENVLDPTPYLDFFEALGVTPPRYQAAWPHQELVVTVAAGEPPLTTLSVQTEAESETLPLHASNPASGVPWSAVSVSERRREARVASPLWSTLRTIDSLRYARGAQSVAGRDVTVDEIRALCPPARNSLWVVATVGRVRPY